MSHGIFWCLLKSHAFRTQHWTQCTAKTNEGDDSMPDRTTLTDRWLRSARVDTMTDFPDDRVPGFGVRIAPPARGRADGRKTFYYRPPSPSRRRPGPRRRTSIGHYPETSIGEARQRARALAGLRDVNPTTPQTTIADLAESYRDLLESQGKKSAYAYGRILERDILPEFGHRNADEISRNEIHAMLVRSLQRGNYACNRIRKIFSRLYSIGLELDLVSVNPVSKIKPLGIEAPRTRVLSPDEIRQIWTACDAHRDGGIFQLMLISGQRPGVCYSAMWKHMDNGWWTLPDIPHSKEIAHDVFLAIPIFDRVLARHPKTRSPWIFPNSKGECYDNNNATRLKKAIIRQSGVTFIPYHFRHTAATGMGELDISEGTVGMILGHKPQTITRKVYLKAKYRRRIRRAIIRWGEALEFILTSQVKAWDAVADRILGEDSDQS